MGGGVRTPRLDTGVEVSMVNSFVFALSIVTILGELACISRSERPRQRRMTWMWVSLPSPVFDALEALLLEDSCRPSFVL